MREDAEYFFHSPFSRSRSTFSTDLANSAPVRGRSKNSPRQIDLVAKSYRLSTSWSSHPHQLSIAQTGGVLAEMKTSSGPTTPFVDELAYSDSHFYVRQIL